MIRIIFKMIGISFGGVCVILSMFANDINMKINLAITGLSIWIVIIGINTEK